MAYFCRDCSYTGRKPTGLGTCPACGSANFGRRSAAVEVEEQVGSSPLKLGMLGLLWAWLIFEIWRKLNAA